MMPFTPPVTCQESEALRFRSSKKWQAVDPHRTERATQAKPRSPQSWAANQKAKTHTSESLRPTSCSQSCASNKTTKLDVLPEQHHSRSTHRTIPMDGESSYTKSESPPSFHQTRPTNVSDKQREKEAQINFPPPHDPVWKEVNEELKVALPQAFPHSRLRSRKINDFSSRLASGLTSFANRGLASNHPPKTFPPHPNYPNKTNNSRS